MTEFNLDEPKGVWFDMEGGGRIQLRVHTVESMKQLEKQVSENKVEYKRIDGRAERFQFKKTDEDLQSELFWDWVIVSWEKFFDAQGKPIECNKTNKLLLVKRSTKFIKFVNESLEQLQNDETEHAEATEKNS